ncbi:hypothetical protein JVT61DRAFT_5972 [Boletus reticuloceps]|uniref:F-box domain-containing protein n=1 Tax=Boletus reticuloceps TaxID=495285 RepID=A0A8I2YKI3_9AGAM|nr:hypothetical protein JVT61DRAFT_5972 [Boletus reticuloceps]
MSSRPSFWSLNATSGRRHSTPSTPTYDVLTITPPLIENQAIGQQLILPNLYTQRSSFNPTLKLPNETLQDIFIHYARDYYNEESESWYDLAPPEWINVSYVCRRWRDVALNCPTLWTYLSTMPQRWTKEFLARSKQAPLKIRITIADGRWMNSTIEKVMDHVERIQELHLGFPVVYPHTILSKFSSHAPRLQYLNISMVGALPQQSFVFFDGNTPALRTLDLSNCPMELSCLNLSALKTLNLSGEGQFQHNMEEFLAVLRCMKSLSHLYLERVFPSCRGFICSATFDDIQKIKLPHLSRLSITAPASAVVALLSCTNFPLKAEVYLHCWSEDQPSVDDDNYTLLASVLAQRYSGCEDHESSIPTIRSLDMEFAMEGSRLVCCSQLEHNGDSCPSTGHLDFSCDCPLYSSFQDLRVALNRVISDMCCSLPLKHVQTLRVVQPPTSRDFWTRIFGHLPDLHRITLSEGNMHDIAATLFPESRWHSRTDNQNAYPDRGRSQTFTLEELEMDKDTLPARPEGREPGTLSRNVQSLYDALLPRIESLRPTLNIRFHRGSFRVVGNRIVFASESEVEYGNY